MEPEIQLLAAGRFREAALAASAGNLDDPDRRTIYGLALGGCGDFAGSFAQLQRVAEIRPTEPHPCLDLLPILRDCGREDQIEPWLLAVLRARPASPLVALELARHYRAEGCMARARELARHALALTPRSAEAHRLMAWILADLGDLAASAEHSGQAVALDPGDAAAWSNLGVALTDLGRHQEGEHAHKQALALAPGSPRIRVNRAVNLLAQGRMEEAWEDYEWRLRLPGHTGLPPGQLLPALAPGGRLDGRTILLTHEDGFGDTLQFARFAPLLAQLGATVLAHAPPPLERLLGSLGHGITILPSSAKLPAFDYHCPYTSLPRAFGVGLGTIPAAPYLFADPALAAHWRALLPAADRKIGLVWAGQARPWLEGYGPLDGRRSMRLNDFAPLGAITGITWISLQKSSAGGELDRPPAGIELHDAMPQVHDFADTAAIIAALDAVISVDTSVAHLAGAMGKPVLLLDRFDTCWRWLRLRRDNPWYPSLTIFRQNRIGDWRAPVDQIADYLCTTEAF
jgi:Flp pilus assembly protein TadD